MNKAKETVAVLDLAKELFRLDDGKLYWRKARGSVKGGGRAGTITPFGYRVVRLEGRNYKEHRLIYSMHHNRWPVGQIDHIDGVRDNNKIENLREVTRAENARAFRRPSAGVSSQYRGVCFCKRNQKWCAKIRKDGTRYHLGYFTSETDAARAYNLGAIRMGFFKEALNIITETDQSAPALLPKVVLDNSEEKWFNPNHAAARNPEPSRIQC